jgi:probable phosphoglycerate mutase
VAHEIWLIRHGETEWSASGQHTGRTDIPLTETGRRQAAALGRHLGGRRFALVLVSPLGRARETCRLAGYGDQAQVTDDLLEWHYGPWEGRTTKEIRAERPGWLIWTADMTGGETLDQVGVRVRRVIDRAAAAGGDVGLFAHGHVLRILAACWIGLEPAAARLLALGTAAVSVLGYEHENRVIREWNRDWRLAPEDRQAEET